MDDRTGELLMAAARSMRRRFASALKEYDVTPAQARALRVVAEQPGLRLAALAEHLRMVPRSATDVVDALEQRGLVARQPDPADRRATCVVLTPEGLKLRRTVDRVRARESDRFLDALSARDRAALTRILQQLV